MQSIVKIPTLFTILACLNALASANDFKLNKSGEIDTQLAYRNSNSILKYTDPADPNSRMLGKGGILNNSSFTLQPQFIADSYSYGSDVTFDIGMAYDKNNSLANIKYRMVLFAKNELATLQFGSTYSIYKTLTVSPSLKAVALGGIGGDYVNWINPNLDLTLKTYTASNFLLKPSLPSTSDTYLLKNGRTIITKAMANKAQANKINLFSTNINQWEVGLSFTPSTQTHGLFSYASSGNAFSTSQTLNALDIVAKNIITAGVSYNVAAGELQAKISAIGEVGKNHRLNRKNIKAYELSALFSYKTLSFSAAYGSWLKSNMPTNLYGLASVSKGNTSYFALGSSYDYKDIKLSLGYFNSDSLWMSPGSAASGKKPNNFQNYSLGADYSIIKNFTSYAEINKFKFINKDLSHTYRGYVSVLGLKYKF